EDGIRDRNVTGVQTCALPISFFPSSATPTGLISNAANASTNENSSATTRLGFLSMFVVPPSCFIVVPFLLLSSFLDWSEPLSLTLPQAANKISVTVINNRPIHLDLCFIVFTP